VEEVKPQVVAVDLSGVPDLEYTALKMLIQAEKSQRRLGVSVWLVGLNTAVWNIIQRSPLGATLGRQGLFLQPGDGGCQLSGFVRQGRRSAAIRLIFVYSERRSWRRSLIVEGLGLSLCEVNPFILRQPEILTERHHGRI
jgi:hypothetical protein